MRAGFEGSYRFPGPRSALLSRPSVQTILPAPPLPAAAAAVPYRRHWGKLLEPAKPCPFTVG